MAAKRPLQLFVLRTARPLTTRACPLRYSPQDASRRALSLLAGPRRHVLRPCTSFFQQRHHSAFPSDKKSKAYSFDDVIRILENPSDSRLLIDVREPAEYNTNSIPTALNIPIASHPDALLLSPEEFEDRFGWPKPPLNKELVFFCKAGVRSSAAAQLAKQSGYVR